MLQRLAMALGQVKSETITKRNKTNHTFVVYREKEISKKVYNNIMNPINV